MSYKLFYADCFDWLSERPENSVHAIVTDPPYGLIEYSKSELEKKRAGKGGIWRLPPSFDGAKRAPLPRFSVINDDPKARDNLYTFFYEWALLAKKVLVPGGHIILASTPLLADIVSMALREAGLERRGEIIRTVTTLRGGDRPKGSENEYSDISVIPKGTWEPWLLFRKPISEKTVSENLKKWGTGGLRRSDKDTPVVDLYQSGRTSKKEKAIAPHPSLKPQDFMRKLVWLALPLGKGLVLDPFCGGGSTIAAAEFCGYDSIGIECDNEYYNICLNSIDRLSSEI